MDVGQELIFIEAFVQAQRRERARFELGSAKRRGAFLSRLCHQYADLLDPRYLIPIAPSGASPEAIVALLRGRGAGRSCYAISTIDALDGQVVDLAEGLRRAVGHGLPSILLADPGRLGYFEAEQEQGPPPRFLLVR